MPSTKTFLFNVQALKTRLRIDLVECASTPPNLGHFELWAHVFIVIL